MADLHSPFGGPLTRDQAYPLASLLKAVADPARLQILSLIAEAGCGGVVGVYLIEKVAMAQPTMAFHLRTLHQAGLIEREQQGTFVFNRINPDTFRQLSAALSPPKRGARRG